MRQATAAFAPERVVLKGQNPLSRTTLHGWPAIALGAVFLLMGLPILGVGLGWVETPPSSIHAPLWVIGIAGGAFSGCGCWLLVHGFKGLRCEWNMGHGKQQMPDRPWLWDYPWRARGSTDNHLKDAWGGLVALGVFTVFLAPFNWIAFVSTSGGLFWKGLTGFFDLIILLGIGGYLKNTLGQYQRFGNGSVRFSQFPFFLGESMELTLERMPIDLTTIHLTLRCIEEAYEIRKREGGRKRESVVVCYQMYHDEQTIRGEEVNEMGELRCSWNLPDDPQLSSTPSERPATFWELEVRGERHGMDYHSCFLLPIYGKAD